MCGAADLRAGKAPAASSTLHKAGSATLAAPSFTVDQTTWREHPASSTVSGGGAAVITYTAPDRFHDADDQIRHHPDALPSEPRRLIPSGRHAGDLTARVRSGDSDGST